MSSSSLALKSIIFKKYLVIKKIDEGSFGAIYLGQNIFTKEKCAIKIEPRKIDEPLLEQEAYILFSLQGPGLPKLISFGKTKFLSILIQSLLGPSLWSLLNKYHIKFTIKDVCMLSIQMLERLEFIHSKNYIHRDIKPQNFLMGIKEDINMVYLIDFGLSKKYRSKKGKHIKFCFNKNITGTPRYCSINALRGVEQSRRDDLESLFYVILFFMRGNLPWQNLKIKSKMERFNAINQIKKNINYKILCKNLPKELYEFGNYIRHLKFEEEPDYIFMKKCFYSILNNINEIFDNNFSWFKDNKLFEQYSSNKKIILNGNNLNNNLKKRKSSHKRLFDKISSSLEKKNYKNNLIKNSSSNMIKDNITLKLINMENKENNIKKFNSYVNKEIKINSYYDDNNKKKLIINNKDFANTFNRNLNSNNLISKNKTQFYSSDYSRKKILLNNNVNNQINNFRSNNKLLKNIFSTKNKILYNSPSFVVNLKRKENSMKNLNIKFINKELKNKIIGNFNNAQSFQNIRIRNNINFDKENKNKIINLNKYFNQKQNLYNSIRFRKNINLNLSDMTNIKIFNPHQKFNSFSNMTTEANNNEIKRTNTGTYLNNSNLYPNSNNKLRILNLKNTQYNSTISRNMNKINNPNINLNIKLINNNNYNNILLKNGKNEIRFKKDLNDDININKNKEVNNYRITKYITHRKTLNNDNLKIIDMDKFKNQKEILRNKIRMMNIPMYKSQLSIHNFKVK